MKPFSRRLLLALLLAVPLVAAAQQWPTKPIKIIVTFAPGGSSDIVARLIGPPLADKLGQPVIIDNRPGGGATIGGAAVAQAPADGYTLMLSNTAPISISPFMLDKPTYDPVKSFTHISYIGSVPNVFVVNPSVPAKNYTELVAWLNKQPNAIGYGSGGVGSIGHIVGEVIKQEAGVKMEHVPYKGSSPMHTDLLGGQILFAIDTLPQNVPLHQRRQAARNRRYVAHPDGPRTGPADRDRDRPAEAARRELLRALGPGRVAEADRRPAEHGDERSARDAGRPEEARGLRRRLAQNVDGRVPGLRREAGRRLGAGRQGVRSDAELTVRDGARGSARRWR